MKLDQKVCVCLPLKISWFAGWSRGIFRLVRDEMFVCGRSLCNQLGKQLNIRQTVSENSVYQYLMPIMSINYNLRSLLTLTSEIFVEQIILNKAYQILHRCFQFGVLYQIFRPMQLSNMVKENYYSATKFWKMYCGYKF